MLKGKQEHQMQISKCKIWDQAKVTNLAFYLFFTDHGHFYNSLGRSTVGAEKYKPRMNCELAHQTQNLEPSIKMLCHLRLNICQASSSMIY